jgi:NADH-quinone oxidoreductase subunit A
MALGGVIGIAIFIALFGSALLLLAAKIGKKKYKYDSVKYESYECGITPQEKSDTKISVKFYLTAILFIIFDIEIIFMYPWAVSFKTFIESGLGLQALIGMGVFIGIFIFGLFWEVKSKALDWE